MFFLLIWLSCWWNHCQIKVETTQVNTDTNTLAHTHAHLHTYMHTRTHTHTHTHTLTLHPISPLPQPSPPPAPINTHITFASPSLRTDVQIHLIIGDGLPTTFNEVLQLGNKIYQWCNQNGEQYWHRYNQIQIVNTVQTALLCWRFSSKQSRSSKPRSWPDILCCTFKYIYIQIHIHIHKNQSLLILGDIHYRPVQTWVYNVCNSWPHDEIRRNQEDRHQEL